MSEIARLRKQIELECEAMKRAMNGYAIVASHDVINHRYNELGRCQEELEKHVGSAEAAQITVDTYIKHVG
ncbi:hypothetical protein [Tengunoibacter tsumagoiensis]|uniref:Uncharacterized protein n=1 Tax=Tengunoibacter tsumagoiensis TaxID=2014871 RepID=A0A401ZVE1_9CHLR|nr:hypothetical protein [Tengunoibacter tsumagoiensis]GCE10898.1 hypothetical protein KTT_07570 [Tengunoibacter tsumagoiensis]